MRPSSAALWFRTRMDCLNGESSTAHRESQASFFWRARSHATYSFKLKFHLISSVIRLRHEQLAQYPGLPSAILSSQPYPFNDAHPPPPSTWTQVTQRIKVLQIDNKLKKRWVLHMFIHSYINISSAYRYLVPYIMYFYHKTNMKYVSYRLREINDFDLIECAGHFFAYASHFVFLRDVWIRTQRAAVAWLAGALPT